MKTPTRQAVVKRIQRQLDKWHGNIMCYEMASEVLEIVEKSYLPLKNEWEWKTTKRKKR